MEVTGVLFTVYLYKMSVNPKFLTAYLLLSYLKDIIKVILNILSKGGQCLYIVVLKLKMAMSKA